MIDSEQEKQLVNNFVSMMTKPDFMDEELEAAIEATKDIPIKIDHTERDYLQKLIDTHDVKGINRFFGHPVELFGFDAE